ncbi:MAG: S-layer homology domain-containing protein [Paenibacillaceae bacterium]|nr:S-layer homology domain-containing protein [Paenibacillaceae bacterium]
MNEVRNELTAHYQLGGNIDLAGPNWEPIGEWNANPFKGNFDGNGYTISNLTIDTAGAGTSYLGLFGYISSATIRNVGLVNVKITAANGDEIGGLVGYSENSIIEYSYATGSIAGDQDVGGLVGSISFSTPGDTVSFSYASVKATGTTGVGGLIGKLQGYGAVKYSYYNSGLTTVSAGGTPLAEADMKNSSKYDERWYFTEDAADFSEWGIIEGTTFPMHRRTFDRITLDTLEVAVGSTPGAGDPVAFEPVFSRVQATYSGIVPNAANKATVSVNALDSVASVNSGGSTETIDLIEGANTIHIKVSSLGAAVPAPCGNPCTLPGTYELEYTLQLNREDGNTYPHHISTAEQLATIGMGTSDGYQLSDRYLLTNDIDLSAYLSASGGGYNGAKGWKPIGDDAHPFTGTFDGNGHVITNLFIDRADEDYIGLFGVASGAIQSIGLHRVEITGQSNVGGLVGELRDGGSIAKAYTTGTVTATGPRAGGLTGKSEADVTEAYSAADVIGLNGSDSIGGLIGETINASVTDSYAAGNVTSSASSGVGGLIGASTGTAVTDSFWDIQTSHRGTSAGGESGKQTADMEAKSTFTSAGADWDYTTTWAMIEGTTYPMFKQDYEAVKLTSLNVTSGGAVLSWDPAAFVAGQGLYTITSNRYIQTLQIAAGLAVLQSKVNIAGTEAASATVSVIPGDNEIAIETTDENGIAQGRYRLKLQVPAPEATDMDIPSDGYYGIGNTLAFTVSYEGDVDAPVGMPRLPIVIGEGADLTTVYADYTEQPAGERNKLVFKYVVEEGFVDPDGIGIGTEIDLPVGAAITASGVDVPLAVPAAGTNNIVIESRKPQLDLSYSPTGATGGSVTVSVTAAVYGGANALAKLNWLTGSHAAADFAGGANGTDLMTTRQFAVTANGAYTVYAKDAVGNEAVREISIANIAAPTSDEDTGASGNGNGNGNGNGSGNNPPLTPSEEPTYVIDLQDGITVRIDASDMVKETLADGTEMEKIALSPELLEQIREALEKAQQPIVTLAINDSVQVVQVQFSAASLGKIKDSVADAVLEIELNDSSFQLQIQVLDLEALAKQLGVAIQDVQVNVVIGKVSGQAKEQLEQIADNQGLKLIGQAVNYQVTVTAGDQSIEVSDFGSTYMVRAIVLDDGLSNKNIVAVLYDPATRTLSFVPAVMAARGDGQKEVSMKVPHNSIYAIMEADKKTFPDLNGHWAKSDVELLASKLIINGKSETEFAPDDSITRAEFTALMVRALGLKLDGKSENTKFQDVTADSWYASAIDAGVKAGLIDGISENRFAPASMITREQMVVIIANALSIAGKPQMDDNEAMKFLVAFDDQAGISIWAKTAMAQSVAAGIIQGVSENTLAPAEQATRAQAAVMLKRFLLAVEFMD